MKKIILSIAMLAITSFVFVGCGDDDSDETNCKTCDQVLSGDLELTVCENGDGTASVTVTSSSLGELSNQTIDLQGESIDDYECSDLATIDLDL